jgi:3-dehydrosphinganine reductase
LGEIVGIEDRRTHRCVERRYPTPEVPVSRRGAARPHPEPFLTSARRRAFERASITADACFATGLMTTLGGAHVLITGGSSGIGLATARLVLSRGGQVSLVARDASRLAAAEATLGQECGDATRVAAEAADVTDRPALEQAHARLVDRLGPVDVLVTSAGAARPGHFEALPDEVFAEQMSLNYFGTLHAVRAVVPSMIERGRGHLVVVSSTVALLGVYGYSAYAPAKFAVRGLAETLRSELKPHGIIVSCAYPPDTDTPGLAAENATKPDATARISRAIKVRAPERVATAIIRGIKRNRLVITADASTAALARGAGLLGPYLRWTTDRHVRRAERDNPGRGDTPG